MSLIDPRPRRLPWEPPVRHPGQSKPWLRFLFFGVLTGLIGVAVLAGWNTFKDGDPRPEDALPCNCEPVVELPGSVPKEIVVEPGMQAFAQELLARHPAVLVVVFGMDLRTGSPLFLATRTGSGTVGHDLSIALAPRYPFASLAKILTSAAAISEGGYAPASPVYLRGHSHTLYKSQLRPDTLGITMPLAKAFAYSVNPIFGKLGANRLGASTIMAWADSLGFNRPDGLGNGVPAGRMASPIDSYNLAEISSGFVRTTLGSPVQAAMIARKFAGDGKLRPPAWGGFVLDSLCPPDTEPTSSLRSAMLELMRATVDSGTASGGFRAAWPLPDREDFELGGKTGSLDGTAPPGRYEWFAGYARLSGERDSGIAIAVLTVNDFRGALSASWTAASLLAAWARRYDMLAPSVPVSKGMEVGNRLLSPVDHDALNEHAWHRPWKQKKVRRRKR